MKSWCGVADCFVDMDTELKNPKGKIRMIEENKMILLLLKAELEEEIKKIKQSKDCKINWCYLELMVSKKLCVKATHVPFLRKNFLLGQRHPHYYPPIAL